MRVCELKALLAYLPDNALIGTADHHGYISELSVRQIVTDNIAQYGKGERPFNSTDYMIVAREA